MKGITEEDLKKARNDAYREAGYNAYFGEGFNAGFEYAQSLLEKTKASVIEEERLKTSLDGFWFHDENGSKIKVIGQIKDWYIVQNMLFEDRPYCLETDYVQAIYEESKKESK